MAKTLTSAMILHPPSLNSIDDAVNTLYPWTSWFYARISDLNKKRNILKIKPFKYFFIRNYCHVSNFNVNLLGIMLPMLPEQMLSENKKFVVCRIVEAVRKAQKLGASIVTLGAFTSIMTNQGRDLINKIDVAVTSGNSYTASLCINSILKISKLRNINLKDATISVIGATGDIGSIVAKILSKQCKEIILCSRSISSESKIFKELTESNLNNVQTIADPKRAAQSGHIIVSATSSFMPLFTESDLKTGAILCDISVPSSFAVNLKSRRKDVFVFEGGRAKIPHYENIKDKVWKYLFPQNSIFGCYAESIILAMENRIENYSIGQGVLSEEKIEEIYLLGLRNGFDFSIPEIDDKR